jgi:hypothetical protein
MSKVMKLVNHDELLVLIQPLSRQIGSRTLKPIAYRFCMQLGRPYDKRPLKWGYPETDATDIKDIVRNKVLEI